MTNNINYIDSGPQNNEKKEWVQKEGYDTLLIADGEDLNMPETEAQMVHFQRGKYKHYHKIKTELFYFISGSGKVVLDGNENILFAGTWLLVRPGIVHEFINESDEPLAALMFKTNSTPEDTYTDVD